MSTRPPLGRSLIARDPSGTEVRWGGDQPGAGDRPTGLRYSTKRGEGFSEGSATLARRIDRDYIDLNLLNDITIVRDDGSTAWEGRLAGRGGSVDSGGHTITPAFVGWMSHARQQRFVEVYADVDISAWGDVPLNEKTRSAAAGIDLNGSLPAFANDGGGLACSIPNTAFPAASQRSIACYIAPVGVVVAAFNYVGAVTSLPAGWTHAIAISSVDDLGTNSSVAPTLDGTLRSAAPSPLRDRFAWILLSSASTALTPAAGALVRYSSIAVYGNHGVTTRPIDSSTPDGLYLSDLIIDIAQRFCPKLSTAGVQSNTTIVQQAAFKTRTFPYDAMQQLNNLALWSLSVWEQKTLTFSPVDFTDYDWQVRTTDPGVTVSLTGDTIDQLYNGVAVTYQDVTTGRTEVLTPDTNPELADADPDNPLNQWGDQEWAEFDLPFPATPGDALQFGIAKLAEVLRPSGAGTITVVGHIRDRQGHWQPADAVRADDTIAIIDHPNDSPRLVMETNYDDDTFTATIAVDSTFQELTAVLERVTEGFTAAHLS